MAHPQYQEHARCFVAAVLLLRPSTLLLFYMNNTAASDPFWLYIHSVFNRSSLLHSFTAKVEPAEPASYNRAGSTLSRKSIFFAWALLQRRRWRRVHPSSVVWKFRDNSYVIIRFTTPPFSCFLLAWSFLLTSSTKRLCECTFDPPLMPLAAATVIRWSRIWLRYAT